MIRAFAKTGCSLPKSLGRSLALAVTLIAAMHSSLASADTLRKISLEDYRAHLARLQQLVAVCTSTASACKAESVGADELVAVHGDMRHVDYGWLRDTLRDSASPSADQDAAASKTKPEDRNAMLAAAANRLQQDDAFATQLLAGSDPPAGQRAIQATVDKAQPVLRSVLAASEFRDTTGPSFWDRFWQKVAAWIDDQLNALSASHGPSKTLVRLLTFGSILIALTLLVWWYIRQLRQQRIAIGASGRLPHPDSASAVAWQQWLEQAHTQAAAAEWREAVHLLYWSAISRLESLGKWPADRARTPREYLQLLPPEDRKRPDLATLTRSFERIWYGPSLARESDFQNALALLERLASE